jgi:hypothetical protein
MKPPPDPLTLQPVSGPNPARPISAEPNAVSVAKSVSVALGHSLKLTEPRRVLAASSPQSTGRQSSVANANMALRVAVIDGADRMVYSDVRDRKGWAQPLAVSEALRDAGRHSGVRDVPSSPQPRVVREVEARPSSARSDSLPTTSPYQVGKASVRGPALNAPSRVETRMPKEVVAAARQPSAVSRSR